MASKLVTLFPCGYYHLHAIFFEVPRIEELQDPEISPRREEVGRRTLGDYRDFLLPFFYHDRFRLLHYSKTIS